MLVLLIVLVLLAGGGFLWWRAGFTFDISRFFAAVSEEGTMTVQCGETQNVITWTYDSTADSNSIQRGNNGIKNLPDCATYWCWLPREHFPHQVPVPGAPAMYVDTDLQQGVCYEYRIKYQAQVESNHAFCPTGCNLGPAEPTVVVTCDATDGPCEILLGDSTAVAWTSTGATECTSSVLGPGTATSGTGAAISGSSVFTPPAVGTYTYTYACTGDGGSASDSVQVTVVAETEEGILACEAGQPTVTSGQAVTFSAENGTSIAWSAPAGDPDSGEGSTFQTVFTHFGQPETRTVQVTAFDNETEQEATCSVDVQCEAPTCASPPEGCSYAGSNVCECGTLVCEEGVPTVDITCNGTDGPCDIEVGDDASVAWTSEESNTCELAFETANDSFTFDVATSGSEVGTATETGTLAATIICTGPGGSAEDSVIFNVSTVATQSLVCAPSSQTITAGDTVDMEAKGGTGVYSWSAPGGRARSSSVADVFRVTYDEPGGYSIVVDDGDDVARCSVTVVAEEEPVVTQSSGEPSLSVNKRVRNITRGTAENDPIRAGDGDTVEFVIHVTSTGDAPAEGVDVRDPLPPAFTLISDSVTIDGIRNNDDPRNRIFIGEIAPGRTVIVRFRATVNHPPSDANRSTLNRATVYILGIEERSDTATVMFDEPVITAVSEIETGPGQAAVFALVISATVGLLYIGYTSTGLFRRREAFDIARENRRHPTFHE